MNFIETDREVPLKRDSNLFVTAIKVTSALARARARARAKSSRDDVNREMATRDPVLFAFDGEHTFPVLR